ncbi:MAG: hypothetical protein U0W24_10665 [Bacteroidales bacterium]
MNDCQPLTHNIANKGVSVTRRDIDRFSISYTLIIINHQSSANQTIEDGRAF